MKNLKYVFLIVLAIAASSIAGHADEPKLKPYPLTTCLVCGMDLGMMNSKPYVFAYQGQEIKVCDESEKATFEKNPAKYLKKLADAEAKLKK